MKEIENDRRHLFEKMAAKNSQTLRFILSIILFLLAANIFNEQDFFKYSPDRRTETVAYLKTVTIVQSPKEFVVI